MADHTAGPGERWVCGACLKTSSTRYGFDGTGDPGWDSSCAINAILCVEASIERDERGRITKVVAVEPQLE